MLVLSRKLGEKIYISDNICITVVDIDRGKIRHEPASLAAAIRALVQTGRPATS